MKIEKEYLEKIMIEVKKQKEWVGILLTSQLNLAKSYSKKGCFGWQDFQAKNLKILKNTNPSLFGQKGGTN